MAGLLDALFPTPTSGLLSNNPQSAFMPGYGMTPQQAQQQRDQMIGLGLLNFGAGTMMGAKPGATMGQAIGQGAAMAGNAIAQQQEAYPRAMMQQQQMKMADLQMQALLAEQTRKQAQSAAIAKFFGGGQPSPVAPQGQPPRMAAAPTSAGTDGALGVPSLTFNPPAPVSGQGATPSRFGNIPPEMMALLAGMEPDKAAPLMVQLASNPQARWVPQPRNGIPGQINMATGEWKADDPALTKVTVSPHLNLPPKESNFQDKYGGKLGEQAASIMTSADRASDQLATTQQMRNMVNEWKSLGGSQGNLAELQARTAAWAQALNVDLSSLGVPSNAGPAQVIDALSRKMALGSIGGEGGLPANNFSEADRNFIVDIQPRLKDTPTAMEAKLTMVERMARRSIEKQDMWLQYDAGGKTYSQFLRDWTAYTRNNPLFTADEKSAITSAAKTTGGASASGGAVEWIVKDGQLVRK